MANLNSGTTSYPGGLDTSPDLTDGSAGDEIVSAHMDGRGAAIVAVETELGLNPAGSVADVVTRLGVALNDDGTVRSTVVAAGGGAAVSYSSGVFTVSWSPDGPQYFQNLALEFVPNATVANAMRVRLVQRSGATPTSASPARIAFRVSTVSTSPANAAYVVREVTGDTALQLSVGSTLGSVGGQAIRTYWWAIDNNGSVELATSRDARWSEERLQSTTAEGGAGAADSDAVIYSTSARTNVPIRCLGYADLTMGSTAGDWANAPFWAQIMGPGVRRTGDVIQTVSTHTGAMLTGTVQTPTDDTTPLTAEGNRLLHATLTAVSTINTVLIQAQAMLASAAIGRLTAFVCTQSSGHAIAASRGVPGNAILGAITLQIATVTGTTAARGYYLMGGDSAATTITLNGEGGARLMGGVSNTYLLVSEIAV